MNKNIYHMIMLHADVGSIFNMYIAFRPNHDIEEYVNMHIQWKYISAGPFKVLCYYIPIKRGPNVSKMEIDGVIHRGNDLPAIAYSDGTKMWCYRGLIHREDNKPAIIFGDGTMKWYRYGKNINNGSS